MILVAALFFAINQATPLETDDLRCAGGVMIHFERGSARIDPQGATMLDGLVNWSRTHPMTESWRIESGGDGQGSRFDAALSRRRSAAIQDYLRNRDYQPHEVVIAVQSELGRLDPSDQLAGELEGLGWVTRRVPIEELARLNPPGLPEVIRECW